MRFLKVLLLVPLVALAACDQKKSDADSSSGAGTAYDTSADANKRFLADYAARPGVTKLPDAVVDKQLKERTELAHSRIGTPQRDSILAAGLALQQAGVIQPSVDVKAVLDTLIDDQVPLPTN